MLASSGWRYPRGQPPLSSQIETSLPPSLLYSFEETAAVGHFIFSSRAALPPKIARFTSSLTLSPRIVSIISGMLPIWWG